jgi:spore coat polysaccharide biosynthesis protein SpsF (cytidylyltransferase family)
MNVVAIIQARMASTRLPGKILEEIEGKTMLLRVYERAVKGVGKALIATSTEASDDAVEAYCKKNNIPYFRGHHSDVLKRYHDAAEFAKADVIVRITSDCPLIDPVITKKTVDAFLAGDYDYGSNIHPPTYPDGLDTEVFTMAALKKAHAEAKLPSEREHVTFYFPSHPEMFRLHSIKGEKDYSSHRWTVDKPEDLRFVRAVYAHFGTKEFGMNDVIDLLEKQPEFRDLNAGILRNEGHKSAFEKDKEYLAKQSML